MNKEKFSLYKEHSKTCHPEDFWGQVKRTVNGVPVSQEQIDLIENSIVEGLELKKDDILLDLCCGNGALSTLLFKHCSGGVGVDFSEHLISVAKKNFADPPSIVYMLYDVVDYCNEPLNPEQFTKMVCYGSFPYLEQERAEMMLGFLKNNFPNLQRIFIGNCPDKDKSSDFFSGREVSLGVESDPDSSIGIWRTEEEFVALANRSGWKATIQKMPCKFYAAHYRYDVILTQ